MNRDSVVSTNFRVIYGGQAEKKKSTLDPETSDKMKRDIERLQGIRKVTVRDSWARGMFVVEVEMKWWVWRKLRLFQAVCEVVAIHRPKDTMGVVGGGKFARYVPAV